MAFSEEWYETELKSSELETLHRPPTVEYSFYTAVKTGDMETVVANCKEDAFIHLEGTGVLSRNTLTNIKYHFVVTAAMLTRYCIDGGLEPEQAYRLSDFYILKWTPAQPSGRLRIFTMKWLKTLPARWFFRKKFHLIQAGRTVCGLYLQSYQRTHYRRRAGRIYRIIRELSLPGIQAEPRHFHQ